MTEKEENRLSDHRNIRIGRMNTCTFDQVLELSQRGWEGYREEMSRFFPLMAPAPQAETVQTEASKETRPAPSALDRLLDRFGSNKIRAERSIVAFVDGKPAGYVFIAIKDVNGRRLAWNGGTAVLPEFRGLGLAKAMMQEVPAVLREQGVDRAYLEVVVKNDRAISAYRNGGFQIADRVIGLRRTERLLRPFYDGDRPTTIQLKYGKPKDVAQFSFCREEAAWGSMWHGIGEGGESLIAYDAAGHAAAYALFQRSRGTEAGEYQSITLYQCEVNPTAAEQELLFRLLLSEVYGNPDVACNRSTSNLSMSYPVLISLLKDAGFATVYEQYLMTLDP
jgi:ribosomal protein S18 acetylase RimI-like enzyme